MPCIKPMENGSLQQASGRPDPFHVTPRSQKAILRIVWVVRTLEDETGGEVDAKGLFFFHCLCWTAWCIGFPDRDCNSQDLPPLATVRSACGSFNILLGSLVVRSLRRWDLAIFTVKDRGLSLSYQIDIGSGPC
jgi:hypothetical protein